MTPNQITAIRVAMGFVAVVLFGKHPVANLVAVTLTVAAVGLDAVDGYIARRKNLASPLGAQLDILGDRVIENLFFTYFAVAGLISLWVPVLFFVRGTLTDFIRELAARSGRAGFGKNSMMETWWGRALVASRVSRAAYGVLKCVCFCYLGIQLTLSAPGAISTLVHVSAQWKRELLFGADALVLSTVAFCLVRGLPVLWEGRRYLRALAQATPKTIGVTS